MTSPTIRVLLIEDSHGDALMVTKRLARESSDGERIEIERTATLSEGLDRLGKDHTDVVLLDLHLPDSFGSDTVRRVREAFPTMPIVVFTSGGDPGLPIRSLHAGAQDYLSKGDFEMEPLVARMRAAIERMKIRAQQKRVQDQLEEAERIQSLGVLGAGASLSFHQLIGVVLEHTEGALSELAGIASAAGAQLHLLDARKAALRALELAAELRHYAGPEQCATESIDLAQFVLNERPHIEAIAGPGIEIAYDLESPSPTVSANPLDLRQVLFNLVINASESILPGTGRICIQTGTIWADPELLTMGRGAPQVGEGLYAQLCVGDSGRGLDAAALSRIFDSFSTTKHGVRGMGLAAALSALRRNGGWIAAENESTGRGARCRVLLPTAN